MLCPNCGESILFPQAHSASLRPRDLSDYQCERKPEDRRGEETLNGNLDGQWCLCPAHLSELTAQGNFSYSGKQIGGGDHFPKQVIHVLQAPYCDRCSMLGEGF